MWGHTARPCEPRGGPVSLGSGSALERLSWGGEGEWSLEGVEMGSGEEANIRGGDEQGLRGWRNCKLSSRKV